MLRPSPLQILALLAPLVACFSFVQAQEASCSCASCDGVWTTLENSNGEPQARHEADYVRIGDLFYLAGGRGDRALNIYNPETDTWTTGASPDFEFHHFQAVEVDGELWCAGAFTGGFPGEDPLEYIYIYSPTDDEWRVGPTIPRPRGGAGVVVRERKLYLVCGITNGHIDGHVTWFDEYDLDTGEWTILPDAPQARDHFRSVIVGDVLWNTAGRRTATQSPEGVFGNLVSEVDYYDFSSGAWGTLPSDSNIPTPRAGNAAINFREKVLVVGGESTSQVDAHNEVELLDPVTEQWTILPPLLQGRHGSGVIEYEGDLFIASGNLRRGGGNETTSQERYCSNDLLMAQVAAVGDESGYDATGAEAEGYRSRGEVKEFDLGDDNVYGSAGFFFYGNGSDDGSNSDGSPTWVTPMITASGSAAFSNYEDFDNPLEPASFVVVDWDTTGIGTFRNNTAGQWSPLLDLTLAPGSPTSFRLGLIAGNETSSDGRWDPSGLRISIDGAEPVSVEGLETNLGIVFFDITLPSEVDTTLTLTIEGQSRSLSNNSNVRGPSLAGVLFDVPGVNVEPVRALIGHWNMNENTGSIVHDISANSYHGTLTGDATRVLGQVNGALNIDGSSSPASVILPGETFRDLEDQISIAMWVNGDSARQPRQDSVFGAQDEEGDRFLIFTFLGAMEQCFGMQLEIESRCKQTRRSMREPGTIGFLQKIRSQGRCKSM